MDVVLFALRILLAVALYAFLGVVLWALLRDLRQDGKPQAALPESHVIQLMDDDARGRRYVIGSVAWLGRDPNCHIQTEDEFTSARHAQLLWRAEDQAWWLEDNLSRNGTFVNEARITRVALKDGDVIRVGRARFRFELNANANVGGTTTLADL